METISGEFRDRFGDFLSRYERDADRAAAALQELVSQGRETQVRLQEVERWIEGHKMWTNVKSATIETLTTEVEKLKSARDNSAGFNRAWSGIFGVVVALTTAILTVIFEKWAMK